MSETSKIMTNIQDIYMDYLQCESKDGGVLDLLEVEEESNLPKKQKIKTEKVKKVKKRRGKQLAA